MVSQQCGMYCWFDLIWFIYFFLIYSYYLFCAHVQLHEDQVVRSFVFCKEKDEAVSVDRVVSFLFMAVSLVHESRWSGHALLFVCGIHSTSSRFEGARWSASSPFVPQGSIYMVVLFLLGSCCHLSIFSLLAAWLKCSAHLPASKSLRCMWFINLIIFTRNRTL